MFLRLVLFVIFFDFVVSIDRGRFRCDEGFSCNDIVCEEVTCPGGRILSKASYCNCCDVCTNETDASETACRKDRTRRVNLLSTEGEYANELWIPRCDENGNYALKQTKRTKSICMDIDGSKLFGQKATELSQNVTCKCSQHINRLQKTDTYMTMPQEHCTASGDFDTLQCNGNLCYCADPVTGNVKGRVVLLDHIDKLSCDNKKNPPTSYLKPCEKELIRMRSLQYQFSLKGLEVLSREKVRCDPDGTFSPSQCNVERCSCTDENGIEIKSYFTDNFKLSFHMVCDCARDSERASVNVQYLTLKCDRYGNFNVSQCFREDQCFCTDEDGDIISKQLNITTADASFCTNLLRNLYNSEETTSSPSTRTITDEITPDDSYEYAA